MEFCPKGLIKYANQANSGGNVPAAFVDVENKCTGCAICAISCPEIAIKEVLR